METARKEAAQLEPSPFTDDGGKVFECAERLTPKSATIETSARVQQCRDGHYSEGKP